MILLSMKQSPAVCPAAETKGYFASLLGNLNNKKDACLPREPHECIIQ